MGVYEITGAIGAGGMGEVYRAKDPRLDRDVAIKVLPAGSAGNAEAEARFGREAKAVAALSHPNIINVFDTGVHDAHPFVVMELLDGETLRERLANGALPVSKAVEIAVQIARGLGAAHNKGIVHRDLKPENIFIIRDGQVKILDFGLARDIGTNANAAETRAAITDAGIAMGTVGYMAPEQIRAQPVDGRTDLFAFGAVLFEMLSGRRAFQRNTSADTMTAILTEDPPELLGTSPQISPALDRIVRHCLEKNATERYQSARDVAFALEGLSGTTARAVSSPVQAGATKPRQWLRIAMAAALALIALAAGVFLERAIRPPPETIAFETKTWDDQWITNARFGPDGQTIFYSAALTGNVPGLFNLRAGTVTPQSLGDPATQLLSVSSKGELAVLIHAEILSHRVFRGTLARMTIDGGPKPWLEDVSEADWSPDGTSVAVTRFQHGTWTLEYPPGQVLRQKATGYISDPRVSPDGTQVAFVDHPDVGDDRGSVSVVDANGVVRTIGDYWGAQALAWSVDGDSVYFSASELGLDGFRPFVARASGAPRTHQAIPSAGYMQVYDVARDGRLLVARHTIRLLVRALLPGQSDERDFPWLDTSLNGRITPDGKSLVFDDQSQSAGANYALAIRDLSTDRVVRFGEGANVGVSPDGKLVLSMLLSGDLEVYPIGAGEPVKLARGNIDRYVASPAWLPDSRSIVFCGTERGKPADCYQQELSAPAPRPLGITGVTRSLLSEDGRLLLTEAIDGSYRVTTLGGDTAVARGFTSTDNPIAWSRDNHAVFVQVGYGIPARVERVDPATGARALVKELAPASRSGVNGIFVSQWTDGGRSYSYTYQRELTQLFVATGVGR